jgi:hypothetical protein
MIEALVGVAAAILAAYLWETKLRDRVSVHRIASRDDEYIEALIEIYQELFEDDGTNYSPAEVVEFLDDSTAFAEERHVRAENIMLVALYHHTVVGFLFAHFYPDRRKAIISYYGVSSAVPEARSSAATRLLTRLKGILLSGHKPCDYLFFDLQGVDVSTPRAEARKRKARPILFRQSARRLGLEARLLEFPYVCPKVSMSEESREYPFTLMCVPVGARLPRPVPRELVLEFLSFIHLDCYGDLYPVNDPRFAAYREHLTQRLRHYEETLPPTVQVV